VPVTPARARTAGTTGSPAVRWSASLYSGARGSALINDLSVFDNHASSTKSPECFLGCRLSAKIASNICSRTDRIETVLLYKKGAPNVHSACEAALLRSRKHRRKRDPGCLYRDGLVVGLFVLLPGVVELPAPGVPPLAPVPLAVPPVPVPAPPAPPAWAHEPETIPKVNAKPSAKIAIFFTLFTPKKLHLLFNGPRNQRFLIQILLRAN
jgi:hypothetical protein